MLNNDRLRSEIAIGNNSAVNDLLRKGADVEARDEHGATPLHLAAAEGQLEAAKLLISAGADPEMTRVKPPYVSLFLIARRTGIRK